MRFYCCLLLLLFSWSIQGQPKNPKDLRKNCDKYVFNPEKVSLTGLTEEIPFFFDEIRWTQRAHDYHYYHGFCKKPIPVVFEDDLAKALENSFNALYKNGAHIPLIMEIKNISQVKPLNGPEFFTMNSEFRINQNNEEKLIYYSNVSVRVGGGFFEKKLVKLVKHSLRDLIKANPYFKNYPFFQNQVHKDSTRNGILPSWDRIVNKDPIMEYPCTIERKGSQNYPWFKLKNCKNDWFKKPYTITGVLQNDSIFVRTIGNHFVFLRHIGNNYFLAKDHILDWKDPAIYYGTVFAGLMGSLVGLIFAEKDVFYLLSPIGNPKMISKASLKKFIQSDPELLEKYKKHNNKGSLTTEVQELLILEILRREGKIP